MIHFHIKSRGVKGLVFVQITVENYTTDFCFESSEVETKNDNCQSTAIMSMKMVYMDKCRKNKILVSKIKGLKIDQK